MKLKAKRLTLLPIQTGRGENGDWKKKDMIIETDDTYLKKIFSLGEDFHHEILMRKTKF